jgi:hypothetical protein
MMLRAHDASRRKKKKTMPTIMTRTLAPRATIRFAHAGAALSIAAFAGSLLCADQAAAGWDPNYPYCVEGPFYPLDCGQPNLEMCQFTAQGLGRCFANPFYQGPKAGAAPKPRRKNRPT